MAEIDCPAQGAPFYSPHDIYDSAVDPDRWTAVLRNTTKLIKGCAAAIIAQTTSGDAVRLDARWNVSPKFERALIANAHLSPSVPAIWLLGITQAFTTSALFGGEKLNASLWHKRTLQPEGLGDVAIIPLTKSAKSFSTLMVMRPASAGAFQTDDAEILSRLQPHYRGAAAIANLLDYIPLARHCNAFSVDTTSAGIILTDTSGKIVHTNQAAEKHLDGCALLCLEDELAARDGVSNRLLRDAIALAGCSSSTRTQRVPSSIVVKGTGVKSLAVQIMRIDERIRLPITMSYRARIAVFVNEIDVTETATEKFIRRHNVTVAESRLLALLAQGLTLEQAAQSLALVQNVANHQLAEILDRTGVRDQTELTSCLTGKRTLVSA